MLKIYVYDANEKENEDWIKNWFHAVKRCGQ